MDVAATLVNKVAKKKGRKSGKEKNKVPPESGILSISGPATAVAGEGLYNKLTQHQRNITTHIKIIMTIMDDGKGDLTDAVTKLLIQLDSAVTTTHQCFTREVFVKYDSIKPRLDSSERMMYANVAMLVRWADYKSRETDGQEERGAVYSSIKNFERALADIVSLVANSQSFVSSSGPEALQRIRRSTVDGPSAHAISIPPGSRHPHLAALRMEDKSRKASWSPGMSGPVGTGMPGTTSPRHKVRSVSVKPSMLRDSVGSIQSESSTSDEEKRRSDSVERYGQVSPEHMSGEWETRYRSQTAPLDPSSIRPHPIPVPTPTVPLSASPENLFGGNERGLPPLPGEDTDGPPPLPRKLTSGAGQFPHPLVPSRRGNTLPRMSNSPYLNGMDRLSPDNDREVGLSGDTPPPLPIKQKRRQQHLGQVNGHPTSPTRNGNPHNAPPPLPTKQRKVTVPSIHLGSPTTPTHLPMHLHGVGDGLHSRSISLDHGALHVVPLVPVRMESIPGLKTALETPPPKPPRTDRPVKPVMPLVTPPRPDEVASTLQAVRKYNEEVMKGMVDPDAAPPLPLKKKTVLRYKELLKDYHFDESMMQPLYIPGMAAPPPLPPKRRPKRKTGIRNQTAPNLDGTEARNKRSSPAKSGGSMSSDSLSASVEDITSEDAEAEGEIFYLECEETSGYLIFNKEEDGGYTLRGGPVDALISYAASTVNAVKHFSEAFLLTYYTFITPADLIGKLLYRLDFFYKQTNLAVWTASTSLLVRVLNSLSQPLAKEAEIKLIDMVHQMLADGNLKFAQLLRNALVAKLNQLIPDRKHTIPIGRALSSSNPRRLSITDFNPDDLAKQMTVLDNELFQKVDVAEMLSWAAEQNEEKSPQLTHFTLHFNNVSQWTKTQLLDRNMEMKSRTKLLMHFITIMKCLRENYQNFNSYLAILSAVESSPISRLDWPEKVIKSLEEPRALIDNRGSFKNYREAFARAKPPCIPYIGLYLQDLTFIEMQPSKLEDGASINFTKRWKQFKSVDHIRFAQTKQYQFGPDPEIMGLFSNFEIHCTDEELWVISNDIKPSARAQRTSQQPQQST